MNSWCPHYSFHSWDLLLLNGGYGFFNFQYRLHPEEWKISDWFFQQFIEFSTRPGGELSNSVVWKRFLPKNFIEIKNYQTTIIDFTGTNTPQSIKNLKFSQCQFWNTAEQNFQQWWWQN